MRWIVIALLCGACLVPVQEGDGGVDGGGLRCVTFVGQSEVCASAAPGLCGGRQCLPVESCCLLTSQCFPSDQIDRCSVPQRNDGGTSRSCAKSADCTPTEFCRAESLTLCGGRGVCQPINECGFCSGPPEVCRVCGCNGITYGSIQQACVAGARVQYGGGCGELTPRGTNCGSAEHCDAGQACCSLTGKCFAPSEPWRCLAEADGGVLDCISNSDCPSGSGGGSPGPAPVTWCSGVQCGTPGTCAARVASSDCPGSVSPVCGCDGRTYINECWARAGGSRVASQGECPDAGR